MRIAAIYQERQSSPNITRARSAELEAIIVNRVESARSLGVDVGDIMDAIESLEVIVNGD